MDQSINSERDDERLAAARVVVEEAAERVQTARRDFLKLFGYGSAGLLMGGMSIGRDGLPQLISEAQATSDSPYKSEFSFDDGLLYMNIGTTGASPTLVVDHSYQDYQDLAGNPTAYFFGQQVMRNTIAQGFGCDPYELVLSFNTTHRPRNPLQEKRRDYHDEHGGGCRNLRPQHAEGPLRRQNQDGQHSHQ
jgi:hypothetical protein